MLATATHVRVHWESGGGGGGEEDDRGGRRFEKLIILSVMKPLDFLKSTRLC